VPRRAEKGDFVAHGGQWSVHGGLNPCKTTQSNNHRACHRWSNSVTPRRETRTRIAVIGRGMLAGIDCVWRRVDVSLSGTHLFHRDHLVAAAPRRATVGLESLPARGIRVND